jgi:hypothetical protein
VIPGGGRRPNADSTVERLLLLVKPLIAVAITATLALSDIADDGLLNYSIR